MDKYDKMAEKLLKNITEHTQEATIQISMEDAVHLYMFMLGMSRILKIAESDKGGCEYFT